MTQKVPVSVRAVIQRINRRLKPDLEMLKKTRPRAVHDLGDYYLLDLRRNAIIGKDIDPEEYGRELGVLMDYEKVVDE